MREALLPPSGLPVGSSGRSFSVGTAPRYRVKHALTGFHTQLQLTPRLDASPSSTCRSLRIRTVPRNRPGLHSLCAAATAVDRTLSVSTPTEHFTSRYDVVGETSTGNDISGLATLDLRTESGAQTLATSQEVAAEQLSLPPGQAQVDPKSAVTCSVLLFIFGYVRWTTSATMTARERLQAAERALEAAEAQAKVQRLSGPSDPAQLDALRATVADLAAREAATATLVDLNGTKITIPWRTRRKKPLPAAGPSEGSDGSPPSSSTASSGVERRAEQAKERQPSSGAEGPAWFMNLVLGWLLLLLLFSFVGLLSGDNLEPPPQWFMDYVDELDTLGLP